MARIRTIKPEYWDDERVGKLPIPARLLFIGTWNFADDFGVIKASPPLLRSQIFPYDEKLRSQEIKKWLDELVNLDMLVPLEFEGSDYYIIRHFKEHQVLDKRYDKSYLSKNKGLVARIIEEKLGNDVVNTTSGHGVDVVMVSPNVQMGESLSTISELLTNDSGWRRATTEFLFRQTKVLIHDEEMNQAIQTFIMKLNADGELSKTIDDAKRHFVNWYRIELEKKQKNERATKSTTKTRRNNSDKAGDSQGGIAPVSSIKF